MQKSSRFSPELIEECYQVGGKIFVDSIIKWGVNERGEKLSLLHWHLEYAELIGDFRVSHTLTTGCSQVGKTLFHTLLLCFCITELGLNSLWSYDLLSSLHVQVATNFRPVVREWLKVRGIEDSSNEVRNNRTFQVLAATTHFVNVSTSKVGSNSGDSAAGSSVVGFSADIGFLEERSQYPVGSSAPLHRRLDAGRLLTRPIRELGTPGSGNGIEAEVEHAEHHFYPHYICRNCGAKNPLHPKGCLLKPDQDNNYLSPTGRPVDWWKIEGEAIFACPNCSAEIDQETRASAWFCCLKTGVSLRDFLDSLPAGSSQKRKMVAISLSPLLRTSQAGLAQGLIDEGLRTLNADDWQQQALGEPSVSSSDGVSLEDLKKAIFAKSIPSKPDCLICGIDQGRAEYWLWKCAYYLPADWNKLSLAQVIEQSRREVVFGGDILKGEILERITDCDFGIIDNEPDISAAANFASESCLELADQHSGMLDDVKMGIAREGGVEHNCWKIRNEKFLKIVLHAFLEGRYILPSSWDSWLAMPTERSPLLHLTSPNYDPRTGRWTRPKNHIDDLYYAAMFCEVGFYLWIRDMCMDYSFDVGAKRGVFSSVPN